MANRRRGVDPGTGAQAHGLGPTIDRPDKTPPAADEEGRADVQGAIG